MKTYLTIFSTITLTLLITSPILAQPSGFDAITLTHFGDEPELNASKSDQSAMILSTAPLYGGDYFSSSLSFIDPASASSDYIGTIDTTGPAAFAYDAETNILYVTDSGTNDLFMVVPSTGETTFVGNTGLPLMHGAAIDPSTGVLYVTSQDAYNTTNLYSIDKTSGLATFVGDIGYEWVSGLDFDPTTGLLYGAIGGPEPTGSIMTISTATGQGTVIAPTMRFAGISFTEDGQLIGVENWSDMLYEIDPEDGAYSLIGQLSLDNMLALVFGDQESVVVKKINWDEVKANYR